MKLRLFATLLVALIMSACVNNDIYEPDASQSEASSQPYYFGLRLSAPPSSGSRAADRGSYQNGTVAENTISKVWLFFFDSDGICLNTNQATDNAYAKNFKPYCEVTSLTIGDFYPGDNESSNNVEKVYNAKVAVEFENGAVPAEVVAIANPSPSLNALVEKSDIEPLKFDDLQEAVYNFQYYRKDDQSPIQKLTEEGTFVMTNSTYVSHEITVDEEENVLKNQNIICPVPVSMANFSTSSTDTSKDPIEIYVERIVARLDMAFSSNLELKEITDPENVNNKRTLFKTGVNLSFEDGGSSKDIYVEFLGWAVTSTPMQSRLLKSIDDSWDSDIFFSATQFWNPQNDFRSFWAINPEEDDMMYRWFSFEEITGAETQQKAYGTNLINLTSTPSTVYMQENANQYVWETVGGKKTVKPASPKYPTKVIFGARLTDSEGIPLSIAEYESKNYTLDGLKSMIANSLDLYREIRNDETPTEGTRYIKIQPYDLDFETSMEHNRTVGRDETDTYYVYFILNDTDKKMESIIWYHKADLSEELDTSKGMNYNNVNNYLDNMTFPAKIWNKGYSYYFFDIPHIQDINVDAPGYFGVVRNTLYNATINEIKTLGTPVYDPDEVIYPEKPASTGNQLEVIVKTMNWRMVSQNLQLSW